MFAAMQSSTTNFHFGHSRTDSKLEPAVDLVVESVGDVTVVGGHSESTDSHTELPQDIAIQ